MRLTVLGCGDAFASGGRLHTCLHVATPGTAVLIDCGASALIGIRRFGVDPNGIAAVFLSHLHGDHFGGLPWLILDGQLVSRRTEPLIVVGPPGTRTRLAALMETLFPGSSTAERRFATEVIEVAAGGPQTWPGRDRRPMRSAIPPAPPTHALRPELAGKTIACTGDTDWVEGLVEAGRGADLLHRGGLHPGPDRAVPPRLGEPAGPAARDRGPAGHAHPHEPGDDRPSARRLRRRRGRTGPGGLMRGRCSGPAWFGRRRRVPDYRRAGIGRIEEPEVAMTTEPRDPFEAGRAAARRGEGAGTNPHPEGSEPHARWAEGHAAPSEPDAIGDDLADFA